MRDERSRPEKRDADMARDLETVLELSQARPNFDKLTGMIRHD
jgi:hypothetical protein